MADSKRINMFFDDDLINDLDQLAKEMHSTRSNVVRWILSDYLEKRKMSNTLNFYADQLSKMGGLDKLSANADGVSNALSTFSSYYRNNRN